MRQWFGIERGNCGVCRHANEETKKCGQHCHKPEVPYLAKTVQDASKQQDTADDAVSCDECRMNKSSHKMQMKRKRNHQNSWTK